MKLIKTINCNNRINLSELNVLDVQLLNKYNINITNVETLLDFLLEIFKNNTPLILSKYHYSPMYNLLQICNKCILKNSQNYTNIPVIYMYTISKIYCIKMYKNYIDIHFTYDFDRFVQDNPYYYYSDYNIINAYKFLNKDHNKATWFELI